MTTKYLCMVINLTPKSHFVFDLDDTLFQEIDFLKSAYRQIAKDLSPALGEDVYQHMWKWYSEKQNVFQLLITTYGSKLSDVTSDRLLRSYREHIPEVILSHETEQFLNQLRQYGVPLGIITDGRSITQRNKLKALGIIDWFDDIIISEEFGSEKPDPRNYRYFEEKYPGSSFWFFGDNTKKDFIVPIQLGWETVCIRNRGENIHQQDFSLQPAPKYCIDSFDQIRLYR